MDINVTLAQRQSTHGDYKEHAEVTQKLKDIMRDTYGWENLNFSQKESLDMFAHKIGRVLSGNPDLIDAWRDIAGYSTLVANQLSNTDGAIDVRIVRQTVIDGVLQDD